jgi:hypothetical protein
MRNDRWPSTNTSPRASGTPRSARSVEDDDQLKGWIERAVKFVGKLRAKEM